MANSNLNLTLKVWRQANASDKGTIQTYDAKEILSKIVKIEPLLSFLGALVCTAASTLFQTVESRLNSMVCCSSWKGERRTATILFGRR